MSCDDVKDADIMIKDNPASPGSKVDIKNFMDAFVASFESHKKEQFISLFSRNGRIEDPVGSACFKRGGEKGDTPLDVFYESNLAQSDVTYASHEDIICGMDVIRDAVVTISPVPEVTLSIDSYAFYQLAREDGLIKMDYLRTFWEMDKMKEQVSGIGSAGLKVVWNISRPIISSQGISGMIGLMKAMSGIKNKGKESVAAFVGAVNSNDSEKLMSLFKNEACTIKYLCNGQRYNPESYMRGPGQDTTISVSALRSAGWFTACRFNLSERGSNKHGVAIFQFSPENEKLTDIRFYWN